jgi:hypothetical protein
MVWQDGAALRRQALFPRRGRTLYGRIMLRSVLFLILTLALAACGRPLTTAETDFAGLIHGPGLDPAPVRLFQGLAPQAPRTVPVRPGRSCQERLWPQPKGPTFRTVTSAVAVFRAVHFHDRWYEDDFLAGWPDRLPLAEAMLFAHEMVHVWQWQNRAVTGYHPIRAALEHLGSPDPYLFDPESQARFLDFGYEQQASIVEEYICCTALDPEAPRTARLRALLAPHFALPPEGQPLAAEIVLPWDGAETLGICGP